MNNNDIPVWEKYTLTIEEASKYFRIGENKLRRKHLMQLFKIRERPIKISKIQSKGSALRFMTLQRIIINWSKALTKQQLFK